MVHDTREKVQHNVGPKCAGCLGGTMLCYFALFQLHRLCSAERYDGYHYCTKKIRTWLQSYFEVTFQYLPGVTEEKYKSTLSGQYVSEPRFELEPSVIWGGSANYSTTRFDPKSIQRGGGGSWPRFNPHPWTLRHFVPVRHHGNCLPNLLRRHESLC
jgi:hypothetical protein